MQGRVFKNRPGRFRDEGTPRPALQHETSYRRGGGIFPVGRPVVIAPLPPDGKGNHRGALGENGLAVFHGQNVVGAAQDFPGQPHLRESLGAGGGEGLAAVQFPAEQGRKVLRKQRPGGLHQKLCFAGFRAEAKGIAQLRQNADASRGEPLGGGQAHGGWQLHHKVGAAGDGGLCPEGFIHDGGRAPLDVIAAHGAHNGGFPAKLRLDPVELLAVACMKGVIFGNDTNGFQNSPSFF